MKIKIFCENDIGKLEDAVNEFIANKDVIDIKFVTGSTVYDRIMAMVMYDDREDWEDWEL